MRIRDNGTILKMSKMVRVITVVTLFTTLSACSQSNHDVNSDQTSASATTSDRFERVNRKIFAFNNGLDKVILKPTAKAYKAVTPDFVEGHIGNFFSNLDDVTNVINNILQLKLGDALSDTQRIIFNSTLGFAGLVDIASEMGHEKHNEDFGQTLAKWGVKSGPYVMLPLLGPSTVRDAAAKLSVDQLTDPINYADETVLLSVLDVVKRRADLFAQEEVLANLSDDRYSALRDLWLQNRTFLINDGKADESSDIDLIDELESLDDL